MHLFDSHLFPCYPVKFKTLYQLLVFFILKLFEYFGKKNLFCSLTSSHNVGLDWLGWVLWHINPCKLCNAESCLCINIEYIYDL